MPKAAIYCRLSEEDRGKEDPTADSESIRNQKALLCRYAQERDWEIYQIYSDEDYAGADRRRPAFNQMLRDAEAGAFQIVLCKTQSRFTREVELVEKYLHGLFPLWGIRFVSVVDNADTQVRGNKKSRQINALVNEWYLEDLSDNIRTVLTAKRRQGQHIGASALYGYRKDPDRKGGLLPDPEAAEIVREIFRRYADGWGKTAIVRDLNRRGVPCPSAYKRLHGLPCGGKTGEIWREATVSGILRNEMYRGVMVQGRYESVSYKTKALRAVAEEDWIRVPGTHESLIDEALWQQVARRLAAHPRADSGGKAGPLAGKVRCGTCGCLMRSLRVRGRRYYQCATHYAAPERCPGAFAPQSKLALALAETRPELKFEEAAQALRTVTVTGKTVTDCVFDL